MTKKKTTTEKKTTTRVRKAPRAALQAKLQAMNVALTAMTTARFSNLGGVFQGHAEAARERIIEAGLIVSTAPDDWRPTVQRVRKVTPERLVELKKQAERLAARIAEAEATAGAAK